MVKPKKKVQKKEILMNGIHCKIQLAINVHNYTSDHTYMHFICYAYERIQSPI